MVNKDLPVISIVHPIFSILDLKSKTFGPLFESEMRAKAIRAFDQMVQDKDPNNMVSKYPDEFHMYQIGSFDLVSGVFVSLPQVELVCKGSDFVKS